RRPPTELSLGVLELAAQRGAFVDQRLTPFGLLPQYRHQVAALHDQVLEPPSLIVIESFLHGSHFTSSFRWPPRHDPPPPAARRRRPPPICATATIRQLPPGRTAAGAARTAAAHRRAPASRARCAPECRAAPV